MKLQIGIASLLVMAAATFALWPTDPSELPGEGPGEGSGEAPPPAQVPRVPSKTQEPSTSTVQAPLPMPEHATGPVVQAARGRWPKIRTGDQRMYPGPAPEGAIAFPDGTWFPPINGVANPLPHPGFKRQPWSPVVSVMRDSIGQLWFQHANGANSSVELVEATERGVRKKIAIWKVGTPVEPVAPDVRGEGRTLDPRTSEPTKR